MNKFKEYIFNRQVLAIIVSILFLVIGTTFAWFTWNGNSTSLSLTIGDIGEVIYNEGQNINISNMGPVLDYNDGESTSFYVKKITDNNAAVKIEITPTILPDSLKDASFKCILLKSSNNSTWTEINEINFTEKIEDEKYILSIDTLPTEITYYKIVFYIDGNMLNVIDMQGQTFEAIIEVSAAQAMYKDASNANPPVLADGMIPVMYDTVQNSWVKADYYDSTSAYAGYDYQNKKWANAVMVSNTNYIDLSGNGHTINILGATSTNEGLSFDGVNDYAYIDNINYNNSTAITIDFVAKIDESNLGIILESSLDTNTNSGGFFIDTNEYGTNEIAFYSKYDNQKSLKYANNIVDNNELKHYTITFDSTNGYDNFINIYLNAVSQNIINKDNDDLSSKTIVDYPLYIGSRAGGNHFTKMILSELRIYNRELSQSEIQSNENGNIVTNGLIMSYNFTEKQRETYMNAPAGTIISEEDILAYFVWIPRYRYELFNVEFLATNPQTINITFESIETPKSMGTANGDILTHPAFTFGAQELTGFWIGKFEVSSDVACTTGNYSAVGEGCNLTTINPRIKPGVTSWRGAMVSTYYLSTFKMSSTNYLTSNGVNDLDIHISKNMEWGAVAYLSHSIYGKNSEITANDNSSYYTGGGATNAYITNIGQSTSGNITGVYDMSGDAWEFVMGVMEDGPGTGVPMSGHSLPNYNSGFTGNTTSGYVTGVPLPNYKYYDLYAYGTTTTDQAAYNKSKLGDAIGETRGWYDDFEFFYYPGSSWFIRGAENVDSNSCGVFSFAEGSGYAYFERSSRFALIVE